MDAVHTPVLQEELFEYLGPRKEGELMIDATQGEGGHSFAFLSCFPDLRIIGIDADPEIQKIARERLKGFGDRVEFVSGWSQDFFSEYVSEEMPDTILIDLGISLFHYERSGRGFSFRRDEKLDMRIHPGTVESAADLIARLPEKDLADLLYVNAEERYSRRIAREIVRIREHGAITSSKMLAEIVERVLPPAYRRLHGATKTFLALRIAVNGELSRLPELLKAALKTLKNGGRMGVISFHSLEDRIVKNFFRGMNRDCVCPPEAPICRCEGKRIVNFLVKKGISPGEEEIRINPPSRSARLRIVEKVNDEVESC
jgi:16S rRNA (cytosine1402-N4)-methyltransferase